MTALPLATEGTRQFVGRTWSAYAALGAGLVLLALASEHLGEHLTLGVALAALGVAEVLWAVLALRGPAPWPGVAFTVLLVGGAGWLVAAVLVDGVLSGADAAAGALQLAGAVLLAVGSRPAVVEDEVVEDESDPEIDVKGSAGPGARLAALTLGSLLFAAVTVPGLAATDAGDHAHMPGMSSMHGGHG